MKKADIGVALYILAAFCMFIIPIPSALLDVLLAINMSIAFAIIDLNSTLRNEPSAAVCGV